jgi:hypothetical protein
MGIYSTHATDVVGYAYCADLHCPDCMRTVAIAHALELGSGMAWGDSGSAEDAIAHWALFAGIDMTEIQDTSDFPMAYFASEATSDDACGTCHEFLLPE